MAELIEPVGVPEPVNYDNSGNTFYGASFGLVAIADNGQYSQNQDVGQNSEGEPTSNEAFILRNLSVAKGAGTSVPAAGLFGDWKFASVNYQELENVVSASEGFDRNIIIKNQYTRTNSWGE